MTFWLLSLLLLIPALLIFLLPVLKGPKQQAEEDRTALNVALYQERLAELQAQHERGLLSSEQLEQGRQEAGRDLLEDTHAGAPKNSSRLGIAVPFVAALLIPVGGGALYAHFGEHEKVALTVSLQHEPETVEQAIARLEDIVRLQPDSVDGWYILGRTYMNEQQYSKAANAFEQAMQLTGRHPDILAQWTQAEYFATDKRWSSDLQLAVDTVLAANPADATTLGFVGIAAFESGNFNVALDAWSRLLGQMDPRDPSAQAVLTGIERAEQGIASFGESNPNAVAGPVLPPEPDTAALAGQGQVYVRISVAQALRDQLEGGDTVFVFAHAESAGQMPLAAQRLTVADLPAEIVLSDADAVMSQMRLSQASGVRIQASIARDGNASEPDWVSDAVDVSVDSGEITELLIGQPLNR